MNISKRVCAFLFAVILITSAAGAAPACGTLTTPPTKYSHVIWIWMENHSFSQIVGSASAPFINSVIADCGLATNYHNTTHLSLPNYVGAVTGLGLTDLQQFLFDCNPGGACLTTADSIFAHASSWKVYMESMTSNCQNTDSGTYIVRHNPPLYLSGLGTCSSFDVPYTQLQTDLDNGTLPAFAFISPNTVNDMHDGGDPGAIQAGDAWLQTELPKILNSSAYTSGTTAVFITFDEGAGGSAGVDCAANPTDESCHVATIVISPYTPSGITSKKLYTHLSLLKTTEKMLGIKTKVGITLKVKVMRKGFNL